MSTQQILGVVGGVVGAFFGYPQLGFVVGSLVGGLLTPGEKTEGPRVDDLKVQVSTYGAGIPILYGTERVGGNVVWSTDKIEMEETTGGKGGAPEQTTYRYFVHMGIVLCETPRDGSTVSIVQIFQDGKLIYDARSGIPIGSALASAENPHAYFVLYQGHADQLPDPGEEAWMGGPGSVPAYRGVVRIRMNAVECPGGRVPQFSFVLSTNAQSIGPQIVVNKTIEQDFTDGEVGRPVIYSVSADSVRVGSWFVNSTEVQPLVYTFSAEGEYWDTNARDLQDRWPVDFGGPYAAGVYAGYWIRSYHHSQLNDTSLRAYLTEDGTDFVSFDDQFPSSEYLSGIVISADQMTMLVFTSPALNGNITKWYAMQGGATVVNSGAVSPSLPEGTLGYGSSDANLNLPTVGMADNDWQRVWTINSGGQFLEYAIDAANDFSATGVNLNAGPLTALSLGIGLSEKAVYAVSGTKFLMVFRPTTFLTSAIEVSDIITDQCQRAGETRFDVSGIPDTDTVIGYKLQNPASARSNIDPLLTAFSAYMVDEDWLIRFKKYEDIVSVATITFDELAQSESGGEAPDAMPLNRAQEIDLPRSVSVSYIEPAKDYQTAAEKEVRQITEANEDIVVELPIATDSDHAKRVAQTILFNRWRAQNTRSLKTSRKFAFVSPGDGLTVEYPRGTFSLWRVTKMTDTGALCEFDVEPGDAELYTQSAIGATGYVGQQVAPLAPPTRAQILDIPILRDVDNNAGPYVAMDSFGPSQTHAELFVGDGDTSLLSRGTVNASAPIGIAEGPIGAWTANQIDETNLLTVSLGGDSFESTTRDVLLAGGAEYWAYGAPGRWEIGASALGDDLGGGRFILSRHLRGQFGTEANTALHQAGDLFVLLRIAGMLRPDTGVGGIGQTKRYRAVTKGRSLNSVNSQSYANIGEGLRPLSPINLRRSSTNDLSIDRRSRMTMNNATGALPLGEASELYQWEFFDSGSFATRIGVTTTNTSTITSAQQALIGVTPGATAYVRVSQVSDSVGLGHELQATI